jgi:hypothetical protein
VLFDQQATSVQALPWGQSDRPVKAEARCSCGWTFIGTPESAREAALDHELDPGGPPLLPPRG